ncbi:arginine--tRNA ligase, partial [Patescibacteria group bacterium]|nr:arginine--tRNA ligase [Patescibacteria group bacterium]
MAARSGNVILYEDLRDEIFVNLKKETADRHIDWSEKKINDTAYTLTMAVLKFTMQKHESNKNITFDIKEAMSFDGYSAPYILYAVARINSLLRKAHITYHISHINCDLIKEIEEKKLLLLLGEYGEVVKKAQENYNPSTIARYCFDLAQAFNDFYNKHSILNTEDEEIKKARLALSEAVRKVLVDALGLLTIEMVDEM